MQEPEIRSRKELVKEERRKDVIHGRSFPELPLVWLLRLSFVFPGVSPQADCRD